MKKKKRTLAMFLAILLIVGVLPVSVSAEGHWADDAVGKLNAAYGETIFTADDNPVGIPAAQTLFNDKLGFNADSYFPGGNGETITRLQLCTAVWAMSGLELPAGTSPLSFNDCQDVSVGSLAAIGVINGSGDGNFDPDGAVSNAQLAVVIYRILNQMGGIEVGKAILQAGSDRVGFSDVFPSDWFYDGIMYLYYNHIVVGTAEKTFDPTGIITNGQLAALLVRAQEALGTNISEAGIQNEFNALVKGGVEWTNYSQKTYFANYNDLDSFVAAFREKFTNAGFIIPDSEAPGSLHWSAIYFWANRDYYLVGRESTDIDPNALTTRERMAYIAVKLYAGYNAATVNTSVLDRFVDGGDVGIDYRPAMAYLVSIGALAGGGDNRLHPNESITRAVGGVFWARVLRGLDSSKMQDYKTAVDTVINSVSGGEN